MFPSLRHALFALALFTAPGLAHAQIDPVRYQTGAIGVTGEQYIRLNVYFTAADGRGELPPGPCRVTLRFYDVDGNVVAESVQALSPNRDTVLDYRPDRLVGGERMSVRAEVIAEADERGVLPHMMPSVEVIDAATGRTTVADAGAGRAIEPGRADFSTFGMTHLQVARLNTTCLGHVDDAGLPPGPCRIQMALVNGNGRVLVSRDVVAEAGETVSLEFAAGEMVTGVRRRMWATASTDGSGFLASSLEIFDQPTGKSAVLFPGQIAQSWGWE